MASDAAPSRIDGQPPAEGSGVLLALPRHVLTGLAVVLIAAFAVGLPADRLAMAAATPVGSTLPGWRDGTTPPPVVVVRRTVRQGVVPAGELRLVREGLDAGVRGDLGGQTLIGAERRGVGMQVGQMPQPPPALA